MTAIESFMVLANRLPADQLAPIEEALATLKASHDSDTRFTGPELAELDRRLAEPRPEFALQSVFDGLLNRTNKA